MPTNFPAPWSVVEIPAGWSVQDANGVTLGWFYCRDHPSLQAGGADTLTRDQARRMAANFARLPELLRSGTKEGPAS